jgi:ribosomal protein S7
MNVFQPFSFFFFKKKESILKNATTNSRDKKNDFQKFKNHTGNISDTFQSKKYKQRKNLFEENYRKQKSLPSKALLNSLLRTNQSFISLSEKFINLLMVNGKKTKASTLFYEALFFFQQFHKQYSLEKKKMGFLENKSHPDTQSQVKGSDFFKENKNSASLASQPNYEILFLQALENIKPFVEVRKLRVSRMTYQVPIIINTKKQEKVAFRWLINAAKKRQKTSKQRYSFCLGLEFFDAFRKIGTARAKRDELHKLAESNRAFIRSRWW